MGNIDYAVWTPRVLSLLRIVAGLLFLEHGTQKLLGFPPSANPAAPLPAFAALPLLMQVQGCIEAFGGVLIVIGLFTRPIAFILCGDMAVAYYMSHFPRNFFPILNGGDAAILYCFVFLFLAVAGGGAWSADKARQGD